MGRPGTRTKLLTRDIASGSFLVHPGRPIRRSLLSRGGKLYPGYYAYSDSKIGTRSGSGRNLSLSDCREGTSLAVFSREGVSWLAWWGAGKSHSCVLLSNQRVWSCEFRSPPIVSVKSSNRHPSPDEQIARAEGLRIPDCPLRPRRQKRFRCQSGLHSGMRC